MNSSYFSQCNNQELEISDRSLTTAKELGDNKYPLAHNLMVRMTINAMGKAVKKNDKGVTSVAVLLTFSTVSDKEQFRSIAKDIGMTTKPSVPKSYLDQKGMVMNMYRD